ncbi:MAG: hypothetical protein E6K76_03040 [Candidatus Eisenbacteria bacterium]|uniref:Uncharacterized protein n=1 Tax=Eiseniibacteriota bacterium TaxID=2212470 RepID=A0A538T8Z9_UNCEI|nr:MAG: hypothetical protein E6K76_03040 [Candidatus Eisenbacteria bacterium]
MGRLAARFPVAAIAALLSMLNATPATASAPGYFVDSTQAAAERPIDSVEADGDFTFSIHRRYEDPLGARLLGIAEATYPPRDRLVGIAIEKGFDIGSDSSRTPLWWCDGLGVARVPYAVTAGALEHYLKLTERFRGHNFRGAWARNLFWTDLSYRASIAPRDEYSSEGASVADVYVAEMNLSWGYDDGTFVPVSLAHRIVVLARDGTVLDVEGDGETKEQVFFSSHRGIGRVDRVMR